MTVTVSAPSTSHGSFEYGPIDPQAHVTPESVENLYASAQVPADVIVTVRRNWYSSTQSAQVESYAAVNQVQPTEVDGSVPEGPYPTSALTSDGLTIPLPVPIAEPLALPLIYGVG